MSIEIEPATELADAGLIAHELAGDAGKHTQSHAHKACANCGSELVGEYCHRCGQHAHVHRSLLHIVEEALHGLLHFDAKIFRTLPLLFVRPGLLTRRYIQGQRARYVAPFALFLFNVFFLFFVTSLQTNVGVSTTHGAAEKAQERTALLGQIDERRVRVEGAKRDLQEAASATKRAAAQQELDQAQIELRALSFGLATLDATSATKDDSKSTFIDDVQSDLKLEQRFPALSHVLDHAQENPALALYKLKGAASKLSFLLVPIALPFLWLMFCWYKDVLLYDHAIFVLYSLSFMSLWIVLLELVGSVDALDWLAAYLVFYPFLHVFLQLKESYQLSVAGAVWRTAALSVVTGIAGAIYVVLVLFITFH